ncbi:uncharacterized protein LOC108228182 [Daucus carota subsp. sativus]|nr:PREDICTED: uncharacterized protein LOC108228182 [Daucus carota subsp. sativus]
MMMSTRLAPLSEEPVINEIEEEEELSKKGRKKWKKWIKNNLLLLSQQSLFLLLFNKKSEDDIKILLSVLGCPLLPVSSSSPPLILTPSLPHQVSTSAEYIIQHFTAATGCRKLEGSVKNMYVTGKVTMAMVDELGSAGGAAVRQVPTRGCFVIWQMVPKKWQIELVVGRHKVVAGSDGNVAWRRTPWLGSHTAKGGVRPLRRSLQGLDPVATADVFSSAQYMGEKQIHDVDCFVLKLSADDTDLAARSDPTAEMIKHVMFGYFSQKNGLLLYLEDSYLTRIQSPGCHPTYWETTMSTKMEDYRTVEGVRISHSGKSSAIITRFGDNLRGGPVTTRMEETWTIDDLAFNVPGLSMDCFIPPEDIQ